MPTIERPDTKKATPPKGKKAVKFWQKRLELAEARLKKAGTTVKGDGD